MNCIDSLIFKDLLRFSTKGRGGEERKNQLGFQVIGVIKSRSSWLRVWEVWIQGSVGRAHRQCGIGPHLCRQCRSLRKRWRHSPRCYASKYTRCNTWSVRYINVSQILTRVEFSHLDQGENRLLNVFGSKKLKHVEQARKISPTNRPCYHCQIKSRQCRGYRRYEIHIDCVRKSGPLMVDSRVVKQSKKLTSKSNVASTQSHSFTATVFWTIISQFLCTHQCPRQWK